MLLSEAIRQGRLLRPESHQGDPFVHIANSETTDLYSDVWGAAVEAVHSPISKRSWTPEMRDSDMAYFVEIQQKYFANYFKMPAVCPGAKPRGYIQARERIINGRGNTKVEAERSGVIGPITSECSHVVHLAGFVEHIFYVHNWSSEQVAEAVEWYEQQRTILIAQNFEHYQQESLRQTIAQRVTAEARQRESARHQRVSGNRSYVH